MTLTPDDERPPFDKRSGRQLPGPRRKSDFMWTDELVALLTRMWNTIGISGRARWSGSEIAEKIGATREAVIGKAWRLHLPSRQKSVANSARINGAPRPRPARPVRDGKSPLKLPPLSVMKSAAAQPVPSMPSVTAGGCTLVELTNETCRWPQGDPVLASFTFCGKPGADMAQRRPYCRDHMRMAYARGGR
jgi:GcrA cell cycle regulator